MNELPFLELEGVVGSAWGREGGGGGVFVRREAACERTGSRDLIRTQPPPASFVYLSGVDERRF